MLFFNFKKSKQEEDNKDLENGIRPSNNDKLPEIKRDIFVNDDDPEEAGALNGSRLPIYAIYDRLNDDYETLGYSEAVRMKNSAAMENGKKRISYGIKLEFEKARTKYNDMLVDIDLQMESMQENGLTDSAKRILSFKKQILSHISIIEDKAKQLNDIGSDLYTQVIGSYELGFKYGLMELAEAKVEKLRDNNKK